MIFAMRLRIRSRRSQQGCDLSAGRIAAFLFLPYGGISYCCRRVETSGVAGRGDGDRLAGRSFFLCFGFLSCVFFVFPFVRSDVLPFGGQPLGAGLFAKLRRAVDPRIGGMRGRNLLFLHKKFQRGRRRQTVVPAAEFHL